jgi:hypothetical protein
LQQYAEALVMAGRSTPAAEAYLRAAERAPEPAAATLRRKAGEQLLRSGRWQRGAEILAPTLSELGLRFPQTSDEALAMSSELWPKLYERGLDFVPKAPADVSARSLERADALWAVLQATFASNPIVAQPFSLRYVLDAYETGDRSRVIIGLCAYFLLVDMPFSNIRKVRPRALQAAETIARDVDDPRCAGWLAFARASSYQNDGLLKPAALSFAQAEQIFRERCTNARPELRACRIQHARLLSMLAEPEELTRCRTWIREAEESEDLLSMVRLRLAIVPLLLLEDDVAQASRMLEVTSEVSADAMDLTALMSTVARTALALYRADTDEAAAVVARNAELRRSPLFGIRLWRSDFNLQRARLLLFLASRGPLTDELLADLEKTLARIEGVGLECHIDHVRVARAALSHLRGERERAIELLDAIVNDADTAGEGRFVRACARLRKGQIVGGEVGGALFREADEELHGLGVRNTVSFARMIAPGFE